MTECENKIFIRSEKFTVDYKNKYISRQILSTCYVKLEVNTLLLRVTVLSTVRSLQSHDEKTFIHKWI
jgi:hypothetical protein